MQALLGLIEAQLAFETPSIGGKDSMSGTFRDLTVPPTVCSFAICPSTADEVITPEFKQAGHALYLMEIAPGRAGAARCMKM